MQSENIRTVRLTSGKIATIRRGIGDDLLKAHRAARGHKEGERAALNFAIAAQLTKIGDHQLLMEELENMPLADVLAIQAEVAETINFPFLPSLNSPDSSDGASGLRN